MRTDFEKAIADKAEQFRIIPDDQLWSKIAAALKKKKRRRFLIWWWLPGIFLSLVVSTVIVFNHDDNKNSSVSHSGVPHSNSTHKEIIAAQTDDNTLPKEELPLTGNTEEKSEDFIYNDYSGSSSSVKTRMSVKREMIDPMMTGGLTLINDNSMETVFIDSVIPVITSIEVDSLPADTLVNEEGTQEEKKDSVSKEQKWSVSTVVFAGPGLNSFTEHTDFGSIASYRERRDKNALQLIPEVNLNYYLSEKIILSAGLAWHVMKERLPNIQIGYPTDTIHHPFTGPVPYYTVITFPEQVLLDSSKKSSADIVFTHHFIQVPFAFHWNAAKGRKFNAGVYISVAPTFLIGSNHYEYNFSERRYFITGKGSLRSFNIAGRAGGEAKYRIASKLNIVAGVSYMKYMMSMYEGSVIDQYHSATGINVGLEYFFK